jgi:hypothetical protein
MTKNLKSASMNFNQKSKRLKLNPNLDQRNLQFISINTSKILRRDKQRRRRNI